MCISGIYSLSNEMKEAENTLSTSAVDIELKEYNSVDEEFDENGKIVMPGDEIVLIPRVKNLGIECYLRLKITYTVNQRSYNELDYIKGNYASWKKEGDYYYYGNVFQKDEVTELFNLVIIPDNLTNDDQGKEVRVHIVVEAIQDKNFDGDWDNVEIIQSTDKSFDIDGSGSSTIIYEDDSENHFLIEEGFFDNLGGLIPGDKIVEEFKVLNKTDTKKSYYLKIENDLSNNEKQLLRNFKLLIKSGNGSVIVKSDLYQPNKYLLGSFDKDMGDTFTVEIELPKEANNEASKILTKIRWIFSLVEYQTDEEIPNTGRNSIDLSLITFLLSTLGFIIVLLLGRRYIEIEKERKNYE